MEEPFINNKIKTINLPLKELHYSYKLIIMAIIFGSINQILLSDLIQAKDIGQNSFITGIPFLRNYYLLFPFIFTLLTFYYIYKSYKYYSNEKIIDPTKYSIYDYLIKNKSAFLFTNVIMIFLFFLIYLFLYLPLWSSIYYRLSGHVLVCTFSCTILININAVCERFIYIQSKNYYYKHFMTIKIISMFLFYHNIYSIVWTAWLFHTATECIVSYFISFAYTYILERIEIDLICMKLIKSFKINYNNVDKNKRNFVY
jgi:hypothetical protein